jgi:serine/threonine protein kinase
MKTPSLLPNSTIGSYQIKQCLGAGAMGEVYLGEHPTLGKRVAIKILRKEVSTDQELVKRFFAEAQVLSALRHPNIVKALDLSVLPDGRAYYVTEYLEGQSLLQLLQDKKRLEFVEAKPLIQQLLQALAVAHQKGIIHRDIKPANIFLVQNGATPLLKLLDFGIAKLQDKSGMALNGLSVPGVVLGTPAYMAPEQCTGKDIQPASDLYSVGVVLFELLTGSLPFGLIDDQQLMEAHVRQKPPLLRGRLPSASPALEVFLQRAFQKRIKDRFTSAEEMLTALNEIPEPLPASIANAIEKRDETCKEEPVVSVDFNPSLENLSSEAPLSTPLLSDAQASNHIGEDDPSIGPVITASRKAPEKRSLVWFAGAGAVALFVLLFVFSGSAPGKKESETSAQPSAVTAMQPQSAPPIILEAKLQDEPTSEEVVSAKVVSEPESAGNVVEGAPEVAQPSKKVQPSKSPKAQTKEPAEKPTKSNGEPKRRYTPPPIAPRDGLD